MPLSFPTCAALALAGVLLPGAVLAADAVPNRIRGKVETVAPDTLTVATREGTTAAITLDPGWKLVGVTTAAMTDIKPGSYLGIASIPGASGHEEALEVLIFPDAMKGTGEGQFPWDLQPDSTMTNALVSSVATTAGNVLTMGTAGHETTIAVPDGTPIVTFGPAAPTDLTPGKTVFVPGKRAADGTLSTATVLVETGGVLPPM